ncbi:MAG: pyrroline-5-carboxylate reductase [Clostridiales bacterium]|nr:pyrroline-5-carboxylate reductase [Clostridiales bacterium]
MDLKAAFIGSGNMGGAFIRAAALAVPPQEIIITDHELKKAQALSGEVGCLCSPDNLEAARRAKFVILCVKPQVLPSVLTPLVPILREAERSGEPKVLVSIAAGITIERLRSITGSDTQPIVRIMPNMPALIGRGLMILATDGSASEEDMQELSEMAKACGEVRRLDESLFDQATVVASCSPAYAFMFIEALAEAGEKLGLDADNSLFFAAQSMQGAAAMVFGTANTPDELCRMVCSPGGSTIAGVNVLREKGLYELIEQAANASFNRNIELGKLN